MFAPRRTSVYSSDGPAPKFKDVLLCERSPSPLAVPGALLAAIWDQVTEGLRAVPRGGAEIGGLLLGRRSQTAIVLAEAVVPIPIEHRFGPSFRLSPADLKNLEALMASLQRDGSKTIVGLYRSRTRNDSLSEESETALLSLLETAHTSFLDDFHYFVAFTPLSKLTMTASASFRNPDGWDAWQHVTLAMSPKKAPQPVGFMAASTEGETAGATAESAGGALSAPAEPHAPGTADFSSPSGANPATDGASGSATQNDGYAGFAAEQYAPLDWTRDFAGEEAAPPRRAWWYAAGAVLLAVAGLAGYLGIKSVRQPVLARIMAAAEPVAGAATRTGFTATWEGSVWRLAWDRDAVEALHPAGAILSIRDGSKEQRVDLAPSDLTRGTIFYAPQSEDLLFRLNLVLPDGRSAEEHVRILAGPRKTDVAIAPRLSAAASAATTPTPVAAADSVKTLRSFVPEPNPPRDAIGTSRTTADVPAPPVLTAASSPPANQPVSAVLPIAPPAAVQLPAPKAPTPRAPEAAPPAARVDLAAQLAGSWTATVSDSPFQTESASVTLSVAASVVDGWFLGRYKVPKGGRPIKELVNFKFGGNLDHDRLAEGAWVFPFRTTDGWAGTVKLRPQGNNLDVTWKYALEDGTAYTFEHVMARGASK